MADRVVTSSRRRPVLIAVLVMALVLLCIAAAGFYWGTGPAPRCFYPTEGPAEPGWSGRSVLSGGRERCYYLYVPPGYDPGQPTPVVLSLHGFLSNPESHALITGWHELADREGFLVVYPESTQYPHRWNAGQDWGDPAVDDVQFTLDLLRDLSAVAPVDDSQVYVNGLSNGGGMSVALGCQVADRIAAIGTVAAAVVGLEDCHPARAMPLLAFHGTADPLVPYEGGELPRRALQQGAPKVGAPGHFLGAEEWVAAWAQNNSCGPGPQLIPPSGDVRGVRYTACDDDADVILYTIEDGGHTWPGGWPIPAMGKTSSDIDATEEMWSFFRGYRLEDSSP